MAATQPDQPAGSRDGAELKGVANLLFAVVVLLVLLVLALAVSMLDSSWLWLVGYVVFLVGFPIFVSVGVQEKWRNLAMVLYSMFAAGLILGSLVQSLLAILLVPPSETELSLDLVGGIVAGALAALAVPGILALLVRMSSQVVLAMHDWEGTSHQDAFDYLWSIIIGTNQPWVVVENAEIVGGKKKGIFHTMGGPGVLVVRPGNAVVLQHTGEISQIVGPGRHRVRRHEKIREMVRLGRLWETKDVEEVLTRDGVPLTIRLGVGYGIESKEDTDRRAGPPANPRVIEGDYPVYEDTIRKAVLNVTPAGWEVTAVASCESKLRDIIGTYTLDQLFGLEGVEQVTSQGVELHESQRVITRIEERILDNTAPGTAEGFGAKIRMVDIQSVTVPETVREQMLEAWSAEWQQRTEKAMRTAAADAFTKMERIKYEARKAAYDQVFGALQRGLLLFSSDDPRFDRYVDMISRLAIEMAKDTTSAYRYAEAIEKLMEHPSAHVVIAPPDTGVSFEHKEK